MSIIHGAHSGRFDDEHEPPTFKPSERAPWRAYGMTDAEFGAMYRNQRGRCAICHENGRLVVDHDHTTGQVRGLLCNRCNLTLGALRDEPELAELMIRYLESHG